MIRDYLIKSVTFIIFIIIFATNRNLSSMVRTTASLSYAVKTPDSLYESKTEAVSR